MTPLLLVVLWATAPFPAIEQIRSALGKLSGADLVVFAPHKPPEPPRVLGAALSNASAERLLALVQQPAAYQQALPRIRRADVVSVQGSDKLVAWELEIPLWNLKGKLWLRPRPDGVDLELAEGDLAPGLFQIRIDAGDARSLIVVEGRANLRDANWMSKKLVAKNALAEPAMTAAAAWILLRAMALEAERSGPQAPAGRWPTQPTGPLATPFDGTALGKIALEAGDTLVYGAVRRRPDGRLAWADVATSVPLSPEALTQRLAEPDRWRAFPGWRAVKVLRAPGTAPAIWEVDTKFPFVDMDATWAVTFGPPLRAQAIDGDTKGAVMGWDLLAGPKNGVAVLSMHPRLDKAGYVPRKFVEAEPLGEHGLALGLAYVDALSFVKAINQGAQ